MRLGLIALILCVASAAPVSAQQGQPDVYRRLERFAEIAARLDREFCEPGVDRMTRGAVDGINAMPERRDAPPLRMNRPNLDAFAGIYGGLLETSDNDDAIENAALAGMITAVDPGGEYYRDRQVFDRSGDIYLTFAGGSGPLVVTEMLAGGPAALGGIQPGDVLIAVDGAPLQNLRREDVSRRLGGEANSTLTLTIERGGAPMTLSIVRARIRSEGPTVQWRLAGSVAVITITRFEENTAHLLRQALANIEDETQPTGYILDLRNNVGGLLDQVIEVADEFIAGGEIVTTRPIVQCDSSGIVQRYNGRRDSSTGDTPIVVLVNGSTMSGAEAVAAALRDRLNATLIGQHTMGHASLYTMIPIDFGRGGILRITVANMYAPSASTWQGIGLAPDVVTEPRTAGADPSMDRALAQLNSTP